MPAKIEEVVQKLIIDLFCAFEDLSLAVDSSCERALRRAQSIVSLLRRYRLIVGASVLDTPLQAAQAALLVKLNGSINQEILAVREELNNLEEQQQKLNNKLVNLQSSCRLINYKEPSTLVRGSALQPSLAVVLEAGLDAVAYVFQVCTQFDLALEELSLGGSDTDDKVLDYFTIQKEWKKRVQEIIRLTSFCSENQLE